MKQSARNRLLIAWLAIALAGSTALLAQYQARVGQVNPQVNRQVNRQLYGGGPSRSVRYASQLGTSVAMQSEVRYAQWRSGALPSEIKANYNAIGPLAPGGPLTYIPPPGDLTRFMPERSKEPPRPMGASAFAYSTPRTSLPSSVRASSFQFSHKAYSGYMSPPTFSSRKISSSLSPPSMTSPSLGNASIRYNP